MTDSNVPQPLAGARVLDFTVDLAESAGRLLADLGAEVVRIEPPGGSASRRAEPLVDGISIPFVLRNANKLGITADLDSESDIARIRELAADADILIESQPIGALAAAGLGTDDLTSLNPRLVTVSVSPFGQDGPYRDWSTSEDVLYAMSGVLCRSGVPGRAPVLPPPGLADGTIGVHVAWAALLAYYRSLNTGLGDHVDVSAFEVMVHGFDPGFGTQGSAAAGRTEDYPRNRPDAGNFYPVFACADGRARLCLLAKRQWRAMFEWLGSPEEFADPKFDTIPARFAAADRLHPLIGELFSRYTRDELIAEGAARGIPIGGLSTPAEVLSTEHFAASGVLVDTEIADGVTARIPSGFTTYDGVRAGFRHRAPEVGEHGQSVAPRVPADGSETAADPKPSPDTQLPLAGLRVLDLGVVVFGAELGRVFADFGADVIKVENAHFPDGLRQSRRGDTLAASVAWGHRNKRSLGVNLRTDEGLTIFRSLAANADVVLANFKPGTLASMGLSPESLAEINPGIVVHESSAFGASGPWRTRMGYGPLVRAACGVSALWRSPEDADSICDGSTVYPDHIAGQAAAVSILAALIERRRTGQGAALSVVQADVALTHLQVALTAESLGTDGVGPFDAPSGVFACAGDDEWCVVDVRGDDEWERLCGVLGTPELVSDPRFASSALRRENRGEAGAALAEWLRRRSPTEAMTTLQAAGVRAGAMVRLPELLTDPQLEARDAYVQTEHPLLPMTLPTASRVVRFSAIADPALRPAPEAGEDTKEIARDLLGLDESRIDELIASDVLQLSARSRQ